MNYKPVEYWAKLPHPMFFKEATSVAVDSDDNVYVFNRGDNPLIIFDKDGNFLETWGKGEFDRPHGIEIDADDNLFCGFLSLLFRSSLTDTKRWNDLFRMVR